MLFFCRYFEDLRDAARQFTVTRDEIQNLNPNTHTCPVFRTRVDAELTKAIYRRVPGLIHEARDENPWGVYYMRFVDLGDHAGYLRFGWEDRSSDWDVPLYEAKLFVSYDHRY